VGEKKGRMMGKGEMQGLKTSLIDCSSDSSSLMMTHEMEKKQSKKQGKDSENRI